MIRAIFTHLVSIAFVCLIVRPINAAEFNSYLLNSANMQMAQNTEPNEQQEMIKGITPEPIYNAITTIDTWRVKLIEFSLQKKIADAYSYFFPSPVDPDREPWPPRPPSVGERVSEFVNQLSPWSSVEPENIQPAPAVPIESYTRPSGSGSAPIDGGNSDNWSSNGTTEQPQPVEAASGSSLPTSQQVGQILIAGSGLVTAVFLAEFATIPTIVGAIVVGGTSVAMLAMARRGRPAQRPVVAEATDSPPNLIDAGARVSVGSNVADQFTGTFESPEFGAIHYEGSRSGSVIEGSYCCGDGPGQFRGVIGRDNLVTGTFKEGDSQGVFRGTATPALDRIFNGGSVCVKNCN